MKEVERGEIVEAREVDHVRRSAESKRESRQAVEGSRGDCFKRCVVVHRIENEAF